MAQINEAMVRDVVKEILSQVMAGNGTTAVSTPTVSATNGAASMTLRKTDRKSVV